MADTRIGDPGRTAATGSDGRGRSAFNFDRRQQQDEGIPELLRRLAEQGTQLAEQQAKLVQAEVRSSVDDIKAAGGAMAGAAVVAIAALGVLMMALSFLLGRFMPVWLGAAIVGFVAMGIAFAMFQAGKRKLSSSSMTVERSRRTLERAPQAIAGQAAGENRHG